MVLQFTFTEYSLPAKTDAECFYMCYSLDSSQFLG